MKYIVYLYEIIEKSEHEWDLSMSMNGIWMGFEHVSGWTRISTVCAPRL